MLRLIGIPAGPTQSIPCRHTPSRFGQLQRPVTLRGTAASPPSPLPPSRLRNVINPRPRTPSSRLPVSRFAPVSVAAERVSQPAESAYDDELTKHGAETSRKQQGPPIPPPPMLLMRGPPVHRIRVPNSQPISNQPSKFGWHSHRPVVTPDSSAAVVVERLTGDAVACVSYGTEGDEEVSHNFTLSDKVSYWYTSILVAGCTYFISMAFGLSFIMIIIVELPNVTQVSRRGRGQ